MMKPSSPAQQLCPRPGKSEGISSQKVQRPQAPGHSNGVRAAGSQPSGVRDPRGCVRASSIVRPLPLPTCGACGRLCAQSLPAFSAWLVCGRSLGIEPCVLFIASRFHLLGCVTLLFGQGHQPSLSAAVTPSRKGWP